MFGQTRRQRAIAIVTLVIGGASIAAAVLGWSRIAITCLAVLLTLGLLTLLNMRVSIGRMDRRLRLQGRSARDRAKATLRRKVDSLEEEVSRTQQENARLDDLARASYRQSLRQHVRIFRAEDKLHAPIKSAALQVPYKLRNTEFAASHGIQFPQIYRVWSTIESVDLNDLPDQFVLKADGGAGSVAVFPLARMDSGLYRAIGAPGEYTASDVVERLRSLGSSARPPYFAEQLLTGMHDDPIPNDVKFYMFYGKVGQILVRNVGEHGRAATIRVKFVDEDGHDFGPVAVGRNYDSSIPVPNSLAEMAQAAKHLSRAIGLPFCRVDLYETSQGVVFGEVTRAPSGGNERFVPEHDEKLGRHWIEGSARLASDLAMGRPVGPLFGTASTLRLYPDDDRPRSPANFGRTVMDCTHWCR